MVQNDQKIRPSYIYLPSIISHSGDLIYIYIYFEYMVSLSLNILILEMKILLN